MHVDRVRAPFRARPFRRFAIVTASGQSYRILSPETMAIDPNEQVVLLMPGGGVIAMIDVPSITEITHNFNAPVPANPEA